MRDHNGTSVKLWKISPFFRLLIPFIGGIFNAIYFPIPVAFLTVQFVSCMLLLIIYNTVSFIQKRGIEWMPGIAIQLIFFSLAGILLHIHQDKTVECPPKGSHPQNPFLLMELLTDPQSRQNSLKCVGRIRWMVRDETCVYENEKLLVYFPKKGNPPYLSAGDFIIFRKTLQPIENSNNAGFDFKKYCRLRHLEAQVFLREKDYALLPFKEQSIFRGLQNIRKKILTVIKNYIPSESENSLLEALMVGYTEDLDPGLLRSYADSGVIHIIAISGLHLALICHILQFAFKKAGQNKSLQWVRLAGILSILWGYSLLAGASPSVIRSAMMFSLVLSGRHIFREAVLYNTLAASAFLLLCFDPNWIWDTGFQLSYAAVLSLRLFSKPVRDLIPIQNKFLAMLWDAGSVSIAAQILTTAISLFYFHRFPSYFLIANLVAVPLSSGILVGGILLSLFSAVAPVARCLGWLLGISIRFLNHFIQHISGLPGSVISPLNLSLSQLIVFYAIIFCFYRLKAKR